MNANELLCYLRGIFEVVPELTPDQIRTIRIEVLRAKPVVAELIPVEVVNPIKTISSTRSQSGDCGCKEKTP